MTSVITGHRKPDADKLQAAVADNQLWLACFLISPASAGISNYSLVEMSFNLAKSEKAKGQ
jgi:hypothetical protein